MKLVLAEKPSVARDIANVLGCRERQDGYIAGDEYIVTWAVGHLVGLKYPDEMDERYQEWKTEDLPILPDTFELKVLEGGQRQFEIVSGLMNAPSVDSIICATDAGREGELIFRYIYQMAGCSKEVERLWISSLTFSAIKKGFENLKPGSGYDNLYESARCRSEADWLIGMNGSRAYSVENDVKGMAIGRVLSPTLAIVVQRELERRNFIPEKYCEAVAYFDGYEAKLLNPELEGTGSWSHFSIDSQTELQEIAENHSAYGKIISVSNEEEQLPPQLLYDLTSLQRDANRIYGMSSKRTLDAAQSLYERYKAITYPRTDSRYLPSDVKSTLQKRLESFDGSDLEEAAKEALNSEKDLFGRFINNGGVSDHHAIIPTGEAKDKDKWSNSEKLIYDLISRRFIAMFYSDCTVIHQRIETEVDGRTYIANGEKVIDKGWIEIDRSRRIDDNALPTLDMSDTVSVNNIRVRTDETKAPSPHTEASLLSAMEHAGRIQADDIDEVETEFGIGTPATRAATIEKLLEKEMIYRKDRALFPTEYGIKLVSILPEFLQSAKITGEWESKLSRISKGENDPEDFMSGIEALTKTLVEYAKDLGDTGIKDTLFVGNCPVCGSKVKEYENSYYCINKECTFRKVYKVKKGGYPTIDSLTMIDLLANRTSQTKKGTYTLSNTEPFISFEYAPKMVPDYQGLLDKITEYGLEPVDKVMQGGAFWVRGKRRDELVDDFIEECKQIGCDFTFSNDATALHHQSGWYLRVDDEDRDEFMRVFHGVEPEVASNDGHEQAEETETEAGNTDPIIEIIKEAGFEFVDKRPNNGSLWFIAGEEEGKEVADKCENAGTEFLFTAKGGRATKHQPSWYSRS